MNRLTSDDLFLRAERTLRTRTAEALANRSPSHQDQP